MPVFQAAAPPSRTQRIFSKSLALIVLIGACAFGIWAAWFCAQITDASAGSSRYLITFLIAIAIAIFGFLLCAYWRTRLLGVSLIVAGILVSLVFFADFAWLTKQHQVAWRDQGDSTPPSPDDRFDLIVYFRPGATSQQIADFTATVLEQPGQPMHPQPEFPWFVSQHRTLPPADYAGSLAGAAIDFRLFASASLKSAYIEKIRADSRVAEVDRDAAPRAGPASAE